MFTRIEADIPLYTWENEHPVHATIEITDDGGIKIEFESPLVANRLMDQLRVNNLVGLDLDIRYISGKPRIPGL